MVTREIEIGKIDYYGRGRKSNLVTVNVTLKKNKNGFPEFTASVFVWNARRTDIVTGGQAFDDIKGVRNPLYTEIKRLWKLYHLNDMHAGTKIQEDALAKAGFFKSGYSYDKQCEYLKKKGLYEVNLTPMEKKYNPKYANAPYRYGHGWIYRPIPAADLKKIQQIIAGNY